MSCFGRVGHGRELRGHETDALADQLPCAHQIHIPVEDKNDGGQTEDGLGSQSAEPRGSIERVFEGHGHETLDFRGREAGSFGLNLNQRRRELRKYIDRRISNRAIAGHHQQGGEGQNDQSQFERLRDQPANHFPVPNSVPKISIAPTLTTFAPIAGPRLRTASSPITCATSIRRRA